MTTHTTSSTSQDSQRRFSGTYKLYGNGFCAQNTHIYIIGIGGVGSWAAEALARTHIGTLTLIDMDVIAPSNINRQLPALTDTLGDNKINVMADRIHGINPDCRVHLVDDFLTADNIQSLLPNKQTAQTLAKKGGQVIILDCVDDMNAKLAIALHCRFNKLKLVVSGGVGGKTDPTKLTVSDLKDTHQDPLLARLRTRLRDKGINSDLKDKFGIKCVYSTEPPIVHQACNSNLACGGYGSSVVVTATTAMIMASEALKWLQNNGLPT